MLFRSGKVVVTDVELAAQVHVVEDVKVQQVVLVLVIAQVHVVVDVAEDVELDAIRHV